jgi:hypothetical protein
MCSTTANTIGIHINGGINQIVIVSSHEGIIGLGRVK